VTEETKIIIESARPKHEMKKLLGLTNKQFLNFKKAEKWISKR
jgi:hypothetical protein